MAVAAGSPWWSVAAGCGAPATPARRPGRTATTRPRPRRGSRGASSARARTAPPLQLTDIDGKAVDIRDLRGHPVLVTFVYANCPDVCPLIMENLHRVRERRGPWASGCA